MPKETFFNLPEEKRSLIEDKSIDEFVEYGYDKASINRIVKSCKIAKGSFYQYFEDKEDLLTHLIKIMGDEKLKYISPQLQNPDNLDFFTLLKEMYLSGLRFSVDNPKVALLGNQVLKNRSHPIFKKIVDRNMELSYKYFDYLLQGSINRGETRPNINKQFISYIISALNVAIIEYHFQYIKKQDMDIQKLSDDMMETVELFIDLIKNGIGIQTGGNQDD